MKKLVFFDIECAGVHKTYAKICAFGYVVCDENFNILEREDILINPKGKFELTDRDGKKGIVLPYEYEEFKKHPKFSAVYPRIKGLLEEDGALVFGHAVLNDVKYLNLETRRFNLPSFKFTFADSQLLFMSLKNDFSHQLGLESIAEELGVEFTPHRAVDDAYATMRIVQAMCKLQNLTLEELIKSLRFTCGKIENYNVTRPQTGSYKRYKSDKHAQKKARARARTKFANHVSRKRRKSSGKLCGKVFNFSRVIEDEISSSIPLVDKIYAHGGEYAQRVDDCTYYVIGENDETDRTKKAQNGKKIILTLNEFEELFND